MLCYLGIYVLWIELSMLRILDLFWVGKFVVSGSATAGHHHFRALISWIT